MPRSFRVRQDCIGRVKLSVRRNGFPSQQALAEDLGMARSTVVNFLTGKPVDRAVFEEICHRLSLDSQEIAELGFEPPANTSLKLGIGAVRKCRDLRSAPDTSFFFGRVPELAMLRQWVLQEQCKLIVLFGVGGIGKTTLSVKLAHQIGEGFDYVIWRSLRNAPPLDALLVDLIQFLTPTPIAELPETLDGKIANLLECLQQRCLLVLDNCETILQERSQAGAYRAGYENYGSLLKCIGETHHKSCIVLTSREKPAEVVQLEGPATPVRSLQLIDRELPDGKAQPGLLKLHGTAAGMLSAELEEPEGQVPLNSIFYVERPPTEADCYEFIVKPGTLIRVKGPRQIGKTSLLSRVLNYTSQKGYQSVHLSFQSADAKALKDLDIFLRWFCSRITHELNLPNQINDYWQDDFLGSKDKCTNYFQRYLLPEINSEIVLGLDEVDEIFKYEEVAADFFGLLRSWHERAKNNSLWQRLRLIITHSKEVYLPLDINHSPFNVGLPVELQVFTPRQVQDLVQRHGFVWQQDQFEELMALLGGHPYLVRVALYHLARGRTTFDEFKRSASTEAGLYGNHLRRHLLSLQDTHEPELLIAAKQVMFSREPVDVETIAGFKLLSMGLVKLHGNEVTPLCDLYRQYFGDRLRGIT